MVWVSWKKSTWSILHQTVLISFFFFSYFFYSHQSFRILSHSYKIFAIQGFRCRMFLSMITSSYRFLVSLRSYPLLQIGIEGFCCSLDVSVMLCVFLRWWKVLPLCLTFEVVVIWLIPTILRIHGYVHISNVIHSNPFLTSKNYTRV